MASSATDEAVAALDPCSILAVSLLLKSMLLCLDADACSNYSLNSRRQIKELEARGRARGTTAQCEFEMESK